MFAIFELIKNSQISETWLVGKRCGSSFTADIANNFGNENTSLAAVDPQCDSRFIPGSGQFSEYLYHLSLPDYNRTRTPVISPIRGPFARYCSGLQMINYDTLNHTGWVRDMEFPKRPIDKSPQFEILPPWIKTQLLKPSDAVGDIQLLYFEAFIKGAKTSHFFNVTHDVMPDYTFGENHLDPLISVQALMPFVYKKFKFVVLEDFTMYIKERINVDEISDADMANNFHNGRSEMSNQQSDKPSEICLQYYKKLQKTLPDFFVDGMPKNRRKGDYVSADKHFRVFLSPETALFNYMIENLHNQDTPTYKLGLEDLLISLLNEPTFLLRNKSVAFVYTHPMTRKYLSKRLNRAIDQCVIKCKEEMLESGQAWLFR